MSAEHPSHAFPLPFRGSLRHDGGRAAARPQSVRSVEPVVETKTTASGRYLRKSATTGRRPFSLGTARAQRPLGSTASSRYFLMTGVECHSELDDALDLVVLDGAGVGEMMSSPSSPSANSCRPSTTSRDDSSSAVLRPAPARRTAARPRATRSAVRDGKRRHAHHAEKTQWLFRESNQEEDREYVQEATSVLARLVQRLRSGPEELPDIGPRAPGSPGDRRARAGTVLVTIQLNFLEHATVKTPGLHTRDRGRAVASRCQSPWKTAVALAPEPTPILASDDRWPCRMSRGPPPAVPLQFASIWW